MSLKKLSGIVTKPWDGSVVSVTDEHGAVFTLEPDPEDVPRAACWQRGVVIALKKIGLRAKFSWTGKRTAAASPRPDAHYGESSALFRMKTDEAA